MRSWLGRLRLVSAAIVLGVSSVSLPAAASQSTTFRPPLQLGFAQGDDWEPAVAVDGRHVYVFWMHFGANPPDCSLPANPHMVFQSSADGGTTLGPPHSIVCQAQFQADAQLAVTRMPDGRHRLYASWMDSNQIDSPIWVAFSDDSSVSWNGPFLVTKLDHSGSGCDKDILVASGPKVWVACEHLVQSMVSFTPDIEHQPFTPVNVPTPSGTVALASAGGLDSHGNLYFTWDAIANQGIAKGPTTLLLTRSSDDGATWQSSTIDVSAAEPVISGASYDFFGASVALAILPRPGQATDRLVAVYHKGLTEGAPQRIYTRYSDDNGQHWLGGGQLSSAPVGSMHGFPSAAADANGVRAAWMDNRVAPTCTSATLPGKCGTWDVWFTTSPDGATGWASEVRIDQPAGFPFPYGDYQSMALDSTGNAFAAWGEGPDESGPGNIFFTRN